MRKKFSLKILNQLFLILNVILSAPCFALVPLESLLLGDFSGRYEENRTDPLNYVFRSATESTSKIESNTNWERELYQYRAMIEDGINWKKSCPADNKIEYPLPILEENALRSFVATMQYVGLDIVTRALPLYAKNFDFTREEYTNMVDRLINGSCTKNITVISLKELRNNLLAKFDKGSSYKLPSIDGNPLFPQRLTRISSNKSTMSREFQLTIDLFKSLCSWANETDNYRLIVPIVKHPVIMAFAARQLAGEQYEYSSVDRRVFAVKSDKTARIMCDNFICRPSNTEQMRNRFPKSIGHLDVFSDMKRLYCSKLRDVDYLYRDQIPEILSVIKERSFDDDNLLVNQFMALVSGVPDFIISGEQFSNLKSTLRASMDDSWDKWANQMNSIYKTDLLFEEGLTLELASTEQTQNIFAPKFDVDLDVNLGEFDRSMNVVGKITTKIPIKISTSFLSWARSQWGSITPEEIQKRKVIIERMSDQLLPMVSETQRKVETKILKTNFVPLVSEEILKQLVRYQGKPLEKLSDKMLTVNIRFNYAPFALKYLRQQFLIEKKEDSWKKFADSLVLLKTEGSIDIDSFTEAEELQNIETKLETPPVEVQSEEATQQVVTPEGASEQSSPQELIEIPQNEENPVDDSQNVLDNNQTQESSEIDQLLSL